MHLNIYISDNNCNIINIQCVIFCLQAMTNTTRKCMLASSGCDISRVVIIYCGQPQIVSLTLITINGIIMNSNFTIQMKNHFTTWLPPDHLECWFCPSPIHDVQSVLPTFVWCMFTMFCGYPSCLQHHNLYFILLLKSWWCFQTNCRVEIPMLSCCVLNFGEPHPDVGLSFFGGVEFMFQLQS